MELSPVTTQLFWICCVVPDSEGRGIWELLQQSYLVSLHVVQRPQL